MTMKRIPCKFFILGLAVLLTACASAQTGIQTDQQMQNAELTQTATVIPDIEPLLIQEGDLPQGYSAGSSTQKVPTYYLKLFISEPDYFIRMQIQRASNSAGQVDVLYYASKGSAKFAFDDIKGDMQGASELNGVGETAIIETLSKEQETVQDSVGIVFIQCHATVHFSIQGTTDEQIAISYVKKLSERLQPVVCD